MTQATLTAGQRVRAYGMPCLDREYEGDVILVKPMTELGPDDLQWWQVHFVHEAAPHIRKLHARNIVAQPTAVGEAVGTAVSSEVVA